MSFAQIRNKEKAAVEMFGVTEYPTLIVLPGGTEPPARFDGSFSKSAMKDFLAQYASTKSNTAPKPKKQKPLAEEVEEEAAAAEPTPPAEETAKSEEASSSFSSISSSHASAEAFSTAGGAGGGATTETLEEESQPTESPEPNAIPEDAPKPAPMPSIAPPIPSLPDQSSLEQKCLGPKTTTCILTLLPETAAVTASEQEEVEGKTDFATTALASLAELSQKHSERGSKLFPFFSVPASNTGAAVVREALELDKEGIEMVAVNARRGWYRRFGAEQGYGIHEVETWVDAIRLGEGSKGKLPESLIVVTEEEKQEEHDEL